MAAEFVEHFPHQRFVLEHLAKPPIQRGEIDLWAQGIRRLAEFPNVRCQLSGLVTEADWRHGTSEQFIPYLDVAFETFGPERLTVGSDWPVCLVAASYSRVMELELVRNYVVREKPESVNGVLGDNARRFWRLPLPE